MKYAILYVNSAHDRKGEAMKRKNSLIALALSALFFIGGCNTGKPEGTTSENTTPAETTEAPVTAPSHGEMRDIDIHDLVGEMKTGWNLGNTFDSLGGKETSWGNPVTTHEMIDTIANAGFNVLRLPVTWHENMDADGNISDERMDRVHEVVDYAFDNGMYVILNCHHETSWIKPDTEKLDSFLPRFEKMWTQIAESFEEYGDHLLFEGLNEPRIEGGKGEWSGGTKDGRAALNVLNKTFVDTVRATGGNNSTRGLLITTFAAAVAEVTMKELEIPDDPNIIVSLHAYAPYHYTYHSQEQWEVYTFDDNVASQIDGVFNLIDEYYTDKGIPVIITEYGSQSKSMPDGAGRNDAENEKWVVHYLTRAKQSGIPCVWWDNGYYSGDGERFGIFNRNTLTFYVPGLVDAIMSVYSD